MTEPTEKTIDDAIAMIEFLRTDSDSGHWGDIQEMTFGEQRGDITTNVCFCVAVLWNGAVVTGAGVITAPSSASVEDIRRQTAEMATIDARSKVRAILSSERFGSLVDAIADSQRGQ